MEGCLICGSPLEYLQEDEIMTCALCGKKEHILLPGRAGGDFRSDYVVCRFLLAG